VDLNVSPDLEAYLCYGIVVLIGAFIAIGQIRQRIGKIQGIWFIPRTWWFFAIYVAVPVTLFWLLDRTGAINDTSFFAAILVAFGYQGILTGGNQTLRAPGDVSQFWTPFVAYADRIAQLVRDQDAQTRRRLADKVIASVGQDANRIEALQQLAKKFSPDVGLLEQRLRTIDETAATQGTASVAEEKTRVLYNVMLTVPDGHHLMMQKKIISWNFYVFQVLGFNSIVRMIVVITVAIALIIGSWYHFEPNMKEYIGDYYIWRLSKTNSTNLDQFRSRQNLSALMQQSKGPIKDHTTAKLVTLLRQPAFPMERVDLTLQILLENRGEVVGTGSVPLMLLQSLRGVSVDARTRIHDALRFLAEYCKEDPQKELADWKPSDGDSTAALERKIRGWSEYWARPCEARTVSVLPQPLLRRAVGLRGDA
jgi:hypothetical protein